MATSASKVIAPEPPANLGTLPLTLPPVAATTLFRLNDPSYPNPLFFSRRGKYRFDSPGARWGVAYWGTSIIACMQEIWGDAVRKRTGIDYADVARLDLWSLPLPPGLKILQLHGPNLTAIRATLQCFSGGYAKSQRWGAALMQHPEDIDALDYLGRRSGASCLALFGDEDPTKVRPYQAGLHPVKLGSLVNWSGFWRSRNQLGLRIVNLPATRPPTSF